MSHIKKVLTTMSLPCKLTKVERLSLADELGTAAQAVKEAEANRKSAKKQLDVAKDNHERLAVVVATGVEFRDVELEDQYDLDKEVYTSVRTDTGEVVYERPLTELEKQTTLTDLEG